MAGMTYYTKPVVSRQEITQAEAKEMIVDATLHDNSTVYAFSKAAGGYLQKEYAVPWRGCSSPDTEELLEYAHDHIPDVLHIG